jgi:hypothetical protein
MKRCPQCHRVETDNALVFCRTDGTTLASDSSSIDQEAGTVKLGSGSVANESATGILPPTTDANINRVTAPTTVLPAQPPSSPTSELIKPKRRRTEVAITVILSAVITAITLCLYQVRGQLALTAETSVNISYSSSQYGT